MLLAGKARALWSVGKALLPAFTKPFGSLLDSLRAAYRGDLAHGSAGGRWPELYADLPSVDFSRDLLEHATRQTLVFLEMNPRLRMHLFCGGHRKGTMLQSVRQNARCFTVSLITLPLAPRVLE